MKLSRFRARRPLERSSSGVHAKLTKDETRTPREEEKSLHEIREIAFTSRWRSRLESFLFFSCGTSGTIATCLFVNRTDADACSLYVVSTVTSVSLESVRNLLFLANVNFYLALHAVWHLRQVRFLNMKNFNIRVYSFYNQIMLIQLFLHFATYNKKKV